MTPFDFSQLAWVHRAELALVIGALVVLLSAARIDRRPLVATAIGLGAIFVATNFGLRAGGTVQLTMLVVGVAAATALLLLPVADLHDSKQSPESAALVLIGAVGALVLGNAKSLLEIAIGVELLSLVGAGLVALGRGTRPLEAGFKYFILSAVTFATLLFGMSLVFLGTGSLDVPVLVHVAEPMRPLVVAGVSMMAIGLAFKLALAPVHFGAMDAYTAGPSSFVGFIMVASKLAAVLALAKLATSTGASTQVVAMVLGLATIAWGVVGSFAQTDMRRLLAYSAVAHAGFLALAAGSGKLGMRAAGFYVAGYGAAALLAFACLAGRGNEPQSLRQLGEKPLSPLRTVGLIVALASLAGVPPLPGFWAKVAVLRAAWQAFGFWPTALAALGGVLGIIYYLKPVPGLLAMARGRGAPEKLPAASLVAVGSLLAILALLSVAPRFGWMLVE